jgi:DNA replication and repair protein RecF
VNILYGDNAQGKTNLLESIYLLGITKSHREFIDNNLIKEGTKEATIEGTIYKNKIATKLEIIINERKKQLKVDNTEIKKVSDYISNFNISFFIRKIWR